MKAVNQTQKNEIAQRVEVANTPWSRMKGLLGRPRLPQDHALLITQCNSIHMVFMKFPIDAVFLDHADRVVGVVKGIQPFALSPIFWTAEKVLEVPAGTVDLKRISLGDQLQFLN